MGKIIDLTGMKFGRLLVLCRAESKGKYACWKCKCDCGKEVIIKGDHLRRWSTKSCGCYKSECDSERRFRDLTSQRFGRLIVLSKGRQHPDNGNFFWLCRCDCGIEKEIIGESLTKGLTKSCGCLLKEVVSKKQKIEPILAAKHRVYGAYKINAKKRNVSFELSFEQFLEFTQQNCYYCGSGPSSIMKGNGNGRFIYQGIDRVDNTKGYTKENCVPCCKRCNWKKKDQSFEEFIDDIKKIYTYLRLYKSTGGYNESKRIFETSRGTGKGINASSPNSFCC